MVVFTQKEDFKTSLEIKLERLREEGERQGQVNEFGIQVDRNKTTNMQRFLAANPPVSFEAGNILGACPALL